MMSYIRFVCPSRREGLSAPDGIFGAAYALRDAHRVSPATAERLETLLDWFHHNMSMPGFGTLPGSSRKAEAALGLSWFKNDASDALARAYDLTRLLQGQGYRIEILHSRRIGAILYEDDYQVVAEPVVGRWH